MSKTITIPTGYLFTSDCSKGELETLSIGDYGKSHNVKADFLGYTKEINGVPNTTCMPLSEKWVITLSTQYGCLMSCDFCECPKIKFKGNATFEDLKTQLYDAIKKFPSVKYTERLNIHFARMGEPIFNGAVFEFAKWMYHHKSKIQQDTNLRIETIHPVLTTSLPNFFDSLEERIFEWCSIKNNIYNGQAGLQLSINSTNDSQRNEMFNGKSLNLNEISKLCENLPPPVSRKYCLNFALASNYEVNASKLADLFDSEKFMVKITPIHNNSVCKQNGIETLDGYKTYTPYKKAEEYLKSAGFDVLVFVPSMDEEDGLVTCGNVILSGNSTPKEVKSPKIYSN